MSSQLSISSILPHSPMLRYKCAIGVLFAFAGIAAAQSTTDARALLQRVSEFATDERPSAPKAKIKRRSHARFQNVPATTGFMIAVRGRWNRATN